jgi:type I restriction-modification system DNA methylase subunit
MALTAKFGRGKGLMTGDKPNDKIYTPLPIAKQIIDLFDLKGKVLDGFRGGGAFYDQLPDTVEKDWCEIDEGRDFFDYSEKVDWIISNPPYSILDEVLEHSFEIADNVVYLIPLSKLFSSMTRIRKILTYGNIKEIHIISASKCGFPFGFPACAVWLKKGYRGKTKIYEYKGGEG